MDVSTRAGIPGHVRAQPGAALAVFTADFARDARRMASELAASRLVFTRQSFSSPGLIASLPTSDRIGPIVAAVRDLDPPFDALFIEHADSDEGKRLARFCRSLGTPLRAALRAQGLLARDPPRVQTGQRLHLLFPSSTSVYPGSARVDASGRWPMGIPRLKLPRGAPSRAALKLEEALLVMIPASVREALLGPGITAVDLGASPGGWSFVLARHGVQVTAVDNGPIHGRIADGLSVEHRREDGFRFRPDRPVDWLTCDMAASPMRVATLLARWFSGGLCRASIFNLKLPMRARYQTVLECRRRIREPLDDHGIRHALSFKQLFHDREEVTGFFLRRD